MTSTSSAPQVVYSNYPDRRWLAAKEMVDRQQRPGGDDPWLIAAFDFVGHVEGRGEPGPSHGDVAGAHAVATDPDTWRPIVVQAYILAREPSEVIGYVCHLPVGTVEAYKNLFFDVETRMEDSSWMERSVIRFNDACYEGSWTEKLQALALQIGYCGKRHTLENFLRTFTNYIGFAVNIDRLLPQSTVELLDCFAWASSKLMLPSEDTAAIILELFHQYKVIEKMEEGEEKAKTLLTWKLKYATWLIQQLDNELKTDTPLKRKRRRPSRRSSARASKKASPPQPKKRPAKTTTSKQETQHDEYRETQPATGTAGK